MCLVATGGWDPTGALAVRCSYKDEYHAIFLHCYIIEKTRHYYVQDHALAEYSDNNRLIALLFLPEVTCTGVFPLAFFISTTAPCSEGFAPSQAAAGVTPDVVGFRGPYFVHLRPHRAPVIFVRD